MKFLLVLTALFSVAQSFTVPMASKATITVAGSRTSSIIMRMAAEEANNAAAAASSPVATTEVDPMEEAMEEIDEDTRIAMEKSRRADELRAQEVFMKKSTGKHQCTNCDWEYDVTKGDSMMIGGLIKPGTEFSDLPADWRCPVCRASKDAFQEIVEEIPGFEVNQGYGFGTNSWTAGQKNLAVFGGLGFFFLLFLSGYAMS